MEGCLKPVIGITSFIEPTLQKRRVNVSYHYIESIEMVNGIPFIIPECKHLDTVDAYLDRIDGLIISGGVDVSPYLYGENPINKVHYFSVERDNFEIALVRGALKRGIPIFGICRGIQVINVALGGTLYQDINQQTGSTMGHNPVGMPVDSLYHKVKSSNSSFLSKLFTNSEFLVNSFHHQAINKLGEGVVVSATSEDGIVEAIEIQGKPVYGVQWHPEDLTRDYPQFRKLFKHLIDLIVEIKGEPVMYYI